MPIISDKNKKAAGSFNTFAAQIISLKQVVIFLLFFFCVSVQSWSQKPVDTAAKQTADTLQTADTAIKKDTASISVQEFPVSRMPDSLLPARMNKNIAGLPPAQIGWELMKQNEYFNFAQPLQIILPDNIRKVSGNDWLFYLIVFLFILLGIIKAAFPRYFSDLFRLFFRTTLKQKQIREQLMQTPVPSLLLNVFFVLTAGLFTTLVIQYYKLATDTGFWIMFLYSCALLSAMYFIKFIGLKTAGWVFNMQESADAYIFIVFIVNKILGVFLLPLVLVLAYAANKVFDLSLLLSYFLIAALFCYRFILGFAAVRNQIRLSPFHFFIYLCAFEIAPLLILYKGLLLFFNITA